MPSNKHIASAIIDCYGELSENVDEFKETLISGSEKQKTAIDNTERYLVNKLYDGNLIKTIAYILKKHGITQEHPDPKLLIEELFSAFKEQAETCFANFITYGNGAANNRSTSKPDSEEFLANSLGKIDESTGIYIPTPEEIPSSWLWVNWKKLHPGQSPADWLRDDATWGAYTKQQALYQDQLHALDPKGLKALRDWLTRTRKKMKAEKQTKLLSKFIDEAYTLLPTKSVRLTKEKQLIEQKHKQDLTYRDIQTLSAIRHRKKAHSITSIRQHES